MIPLLRFFPAACERNFGSPLRFSLLFVLKFKDHRLSVHSRTIECWQSELISGVSIE